MKVGVVLWLKQVIWSCHAAWWTLTLVLYQKTICKTRILRMTAMLAVTKSPPTGVNNNVREFFYVWSALTIWHLRAFARSTRCFREVLTLCSEILPYGHACASQRLSIKRKVRGDVKTEKSKSHHRETALIQGINQRSLECVSL